MVLAYMEYENILNKNKFIFTNLIALGVKDE